LNLKYDEPLSDFALNIKLRRYMQAGAGGDAVHAEDAAAVAHQHLRSAAALGGVNSTLSPRRPDPPRYAPTGQVHQGGKTAHKYCCIREVS